MTAIAMTEPGTGSDLAGIATRVERRGDAYILNGSKTFITGGRNASLVLVVARTSPPSESNRRTGLSILGVETNTPGFSVGRTLEKIGVKAQDTTELNFSDVVVPAENLLGEEGAAFEYLAHNLAQERTAIAMGAQAAASAALEVTLDTSQAGTCSTSQYRVFRTPNSFSRNAPPTLRPARRCATARWRSLMPGR